jgi:hypothetical protein
MFQNHILGMQMLTFIMTLSLLLSCGSCCEGPTPPDNKPQLQLNLVDVSCQEAWLKLTITNVTNPTVALLRDELSIDTISLVAADTTIMDEGLLPSHTYTYKAQWLSGSTASCSSTPLQVRTMDSTNHNWSFDTYTLGDGSGSSTLYDVAIINDTLAYAVGEIWQSGTRYNIAKWDGQQWHLQILNYQGYPPVINTVFAINDHDIWFDTWLHWNGQSFQEIAVDPIFIGVGVNKMWGSPGGELYVVGNGGFIAHRSTTGNWTKIESRTGLPIQDIWGATDSRTGEFQTLAIASNRFVNEGKKLLSITSTGITTLGDSGLSWSLSSIWFIPNKKYYICGDGIYPSHSLGGKWIRDTSFPSLHKNCVRGIGVNDVIVVGVYGLFSHFNGASWRHFTGYVPNYESVSFESVDIKNNLVVAVGQLQGNRVVAVIGKRSQ